MERVLVAEIMTTEVVTLRPDDSVELAVRVLLRHQVGGAPVVDGDGRLVGLLSDVQLVARYGPLHLPTIYTLFHEQSWSFPPPSFGDMLSELSRAVSRTVREVMDPAPPICEEHELIEDVATRILERGASRLPVVRNGRLVGIVARADLLRLLIGDEPLSDEASSPSRGSVIDIADISTGVDADPGAPSVDDASPGTAGGEFLAL